MFYVVFNNCNGHYDVQGHCYDDMHTYSGETQEQLEITSSPLCLRGLSGLAPVLGSSGFVLRVLAALRRNSLSLSVP